MFILIQQNHLENIPSICFYNILFIIFLGKVVLDTFGWVNFLFIFNIDLSLTNLQCKQFKDENYTERKKFVFIPYFF